MPVKVKTARVRGSVMPYHDLTEPRLAGVVERGDSLIIRHVQDVEDILMQNKMDRDNTDDLWNKQKDWKHVARIPELEFLALESMGIGPNQDKKAFLRAIECREDWKTTKKRLI